MGRQIRGYFQTAAWVERKLGESLVPVSAGGGGYVGSFREGLRRAPPDQYLVAADVTGPRTVKSGGSDDKSVKWKGPEM